MSEDFRLRRVAGVIMWHLHNGHGVEMALARGQMAEPSLSESEIGMAYDWAQSALRFREMMDAAPDDMEVHEVMRRAGLPGV